MNSLSMYLLHNKTKEMSPILKLREMLANLTLVFDQGTELALTGIAGAQKHSETGTAFARSLKSRTCEGITPAMIPSSNSVQSDALVKPSELGMGMSTQQAQGEQEDAISVNWLGWDLPD